MEEEIITIRFEEIQLSLNKLITDKKITQKEAQSLLNEIYSKSCHIPQLKPQNVLFDLNLVKQLIKIDIQS